MALESIANTWILNIDGNRVTFSPKIYFTFNFPIHISELKEKEEELPLNLNQRAVHK
jgi:hypothetical protein